HPAPLATAERSDLGIPRQIGEEAVDHVADARVARPLVLRGVADDGGADREVVRQVVGLVEHADPRAAAHRDAAGVRLLDAGEHAEEAGLPVAVTADDADAVTLFDAE